MRRYKEPPKTDEKLLEQSALTPEARETQLIALAEKCAEEQMRNGTASASVIVHYLRLGTTRERLEKEILEKQKGYLDAKTEALQSAKRIEGLYEDAIEAMRRYSGYGGSGDEHPEIF